MYYLYFFKKMYKTRKKLELKNIKEEEKRYDCLRSLSQLLTSFPAHPILWILYNTCTTLRKLKPNKVGKIKVQKIIVNSFFLNDDVSVLNKRIDAIFYSKSCPLYAYVAHYGKYYIISQEWVSYFYIVGEKEEGKFMLFNEKFCCRLCVYKKQSVDLLMNQPLMIPKGVRVTKELFHVGITEDCNKKGRVYYNDIPITIGIQRLNLIVKNEEKNKFFSILSQNDSVMNMLKHILLCDKCYDILENFISICLFKYTDVRIRSFEKSCFIFNCNYFDYYFNPFINVDCLTVSLFCTDVEARCLAE